MDRETLSHYGWIVVMVIILMCLLAFATPFGMFVVDGVKVALDGYIATNDKVLDEEYMDSIVEKWENEFLDSTPENSVLGDLDIRYDDDGGAVGATPLGKVEEPTDLPADMKPQLITFDVGNFESKTTYTPGTYKTVPYEVSYTNFKKPASYQPMSYHKWHVTEMPNGDVMNTIGLRMELDDIYEKYSTYILYDYSKNHEPFLNGEWPTLNGVEGGKMFLWVINQSSEDTREDAVYLAAYVKQMQNHPNVHIAKWDGTKYVAMPECDAEINAIKSFTVTYTVTLTKEVQVTAPSQSTSYVYLPIGTFQAEKDMTWREWLASDYNTTGTTTPTIKTKDFEDVSYDDVIVNGKGYGFVVAGSGDIIHKIPEGGKYTQADGTVLLAGDAFPSTVTTGDLYEYGDYEYKYNQYYWSGEYHTDEELCGWNVKVNANVFTEQQKMTKQTFGSILKEVNGKPITSMGSTYENCRNLGVSPEIPETVTMMMGTYSQCVSLGATPVLPSNLIYLECTFVDCINLPEAPKIPSSVKFMAMAFSNCQLIKVAPKLPEGLLDMSHAFADCISIETYEGSTAPKGDFSRYVIPNGVVGMMYTFSGCNGMITAPVIPASVKNINGLFRWSNVQGTITVHATIEDYMSVQHCIFGTEITNVIGNCSERTKDLIMGTRY